MLTALRSVGPGGGWVLGLRGFPGRAGYRARGWVPGLRRRHSLDCPVCPAHLCPDHRCVIGSCRDRIATGHPLEDIVVAAQHGQFWKQGSYDVWVLQGACRIRQGEVEAQSNDAVLWVDKATADSGLPTKIICYLEGDVLIDLGYQGRRIEKPVSQHERSRTKSGWGVFIRWVASTIAYLVQKVSRK